MSTITMAEGFDAYYSGVPTDFIVVEKKDPKDFTISDLIAMLEMAKENWGDVKVVLSDIGFEKAHYHDTIPINQLYLYKRKEDDQNAFCVIESIV